MNIINNNKIPHKAHSAPNSNVNSSSSSNESTLIDMQALPKNKHRKKLKVKAFCGRCYQFFQNGPLSKICQDHLNKNCNILVILWKIMLWNRLSSILQTTTSIHSPVNTISLRPTREPKWSTLSMTATASSS